MGLVAIRAGERTGRRMAGATFVDVDNSYPGKFEHIFVLFGLVFKDLMSISDFLQDLN